jgi:chromosomal replication initiator protein
MTVAIDKIIAASARHFGVATTEILGASRFQTIAMARHVAMYLSRETRASFPEIGRAFGRDHTTVMNACRKVAGFLELNATTRADVEAIRRLAAVERRGPSIRATYAEQLADAARSA